jgi:hypothetical protein
LAQVAQEHQAQETTVRTACLAQLLLLAVVEVVRLIAQLETLVGRVVVVLVEQKQLTEQAVQATHQAQAHHKVMVVAHHLVLQLRLIKLVVVVAVQVLERATLEVLHHQRVVQEHHQASTEALQPVRAVVVVPA